MDFKYVMLKIGRRHYPIIFPGILVHRHVAEAIRMLPTMHDAVPVSAGDIRLDDFQVFGKSETLKLDSRPGVDRQIIHAYPYFHGIVADGDSHG